jgi:hypothetical protein
MTEHLVQHPSQTGDASPGLEHTPDPDAGNCSLAPSESSSALSAKLRRHGVKVVTALKSLTNSCKAACPSQAKSVMLTLYR